MSLPADLERFYTILGELQERLNGPRLLRDCDGRMGWPSRGVYFFFEDGERSRRGSGDQGRVVRVGTHAVTIGSQSTLWKRLKQHRGKGKCGEAGGGNHRGSIFRRHVGNALIASSRLAPLESWGQEESAPREIREQESEHERAVSEVIGRMPFLWIDADDEPGTASLRAVIERNSIGLLHQARLAGIDEPNATWLGLSAAAPKIRESGLWNVDFVGSSYDPAFLDVLHILVTKTAALP